jgi:hypothetical protein
MSVRSPLKVGGQSVADSQDRLERTLRDESPGQLTRLRELARESNRFNLGFYRDNNTPTFALAAQHQGRAAAAVFATGPWDGVW